MTQKVHHQTERGARIALAKKQISQESYEAVVAGMLTLAEAKELGREGPQGAARVAAVQDEARRRPRSTRAGGMQGGAYCLCGCREPVKNRFRPGHDARLYGELKRNLKRDPLLRNERFTDGQREYARQRGLI